MKKSYTQNIHSELKFMKKSYTQNLHSELKFMKKSYTQNLHSELKFMNKQNTDSLNNLKFGLTKKTYTYSVYMFSKGKKTEIYQKVHSLINRKSYIDIRSLFISNSREIPV